MLFLRFWILLSYRHLENESSTPSLNTAIILSSAFSFSLVSLASAKALSATDLMAKLMPYMIWDMRLHFSIRCLLLVSAFHRLYIRFLLEVVMSINWITALFFMFCAYSCWSMKLAKDWRRTRLTKSLSPFSKRLAFLSHLLSLLPYGIFFIFYKAYFMRPAFVNIIFLKILIFKLYPALIVFTFCCQILNAFLLRLFDA